MEKTTTDCINSGWKTYLQRILIVVCLMLPMTKISSASNLELQVDGRWRVSYPFPNASSVAGAGFSFEFLQGGELTGYRVPASADDDEFFMLIPLPAGNYDVRFSYISDSGQAIHGNSLTFQINEQEQAQDGRFIQSFVASHQWEWWWVSQWVENSYYPGHPEEGTTEHVDQWHTPTSAIPIPVLNQNFFFLPHFVGAGAESQLDWLFTSYDAEIVNLVGISEPAEYEEQFPYTPPSGWGSMGEHTVNAFSVSTPFYAEYFCADFEDGCFFLEMLSRHDSFTFESFYSEDSTYTITVIPSAGGTVKGPVGEEGEEIACTEGSPQAQCQETYQSERGITLKAEIEPGWVLLGWEVNGQMVETTSNIIEISGDADVAGIFEQQTVFLTFDDGPLYGTDDVIRILGEEEVEGTFFMVGVHITPWGASYVEAAYSDFEIGNHSFSHPWEPEDVQAYYTGPASVVLDDFQDNDTILSNTLSISPSQQFIVSRLPTKNIWRLPEIIRNDGSGQEAANLLDQNGYALYGWDFTRNEAGNVVALEWEHQGYVPKQSPQEMVERVAKAFNYNPAKPGKVIVLMHDPMFRASADHDVLLKEFIQLLKEQNYQFGFISDY